VRLKLPKLKHTCKEIKGIRADRYYSEGTEADIFNGTGDFSQLYNFISGKCTVFKLKILSTTVFTYLAQSCMFNSGRLKSSWQIRVNITRFYYMTL